MQGIDTDQLVTYFKIQLFTYIKPMPNLNITKVTVVLTLLLVSLCLCSETPVFNEQYRVPVQDILKLTNSVYSSTGKYLANIFKVNQLFSLLEVRIGYTSQLVASLKASDVCGDDSATITSVAFSHDNSYMAVGVSNSNVYIFFLPSFLRTAFVFTPSSDETEVQALAFSRDSKYLFIGLIKNKVVVWEYTSQTSRSSETNFDNLFVFGVDAGLQNGDDYEFVACGGMNGKGKVTIFNYNQQNGISVKTDLQGLDAYNVKSIQYSKSGNNIYFLNTLGTVYKYSIDSQDLTTFKGLQQSTLIQLQLPSSENFLSLSSSNKLVFMDTGSGQIIGSLSISSGQFAMSIYGGLLVTFQDGFHLFMGRCNNRESYDDENNECLSCSPNCVACDAQICYSCNKGYFADGQLCIKCSVGCLSCKNADLCDICDAANHFIFSNNICVCERTYFLKDNQCLLCTHGCLDCIDQTNCIQCMQSFDLIEGQCICKQGTYDDGNSCQPCIKGCKKCNDGQTCSVCDADGHYILVDQVCECDKNGHFVDNGQQCVCEEGYFINGEGQCSACEIGCKNCQTEQSCTECYDGFVLENNHCHCADKSQYIDPVTKTCVNCNKALPYCVSCKNGFHCDQCQSDSNREPSPDTCLCKQGYFPNPDDICQVCDILGCIKCESLESCAICDGYNYWEEDPDTKKCRCMKGTTLYQDKCLKCEPGCKLCDPTQCFQCDVEGHWSPDGQGQCKCDDGFYNNNDQCKKCMTGCLSCQRGEFCDKCNSSAHFINKTGICVCQTNYYLDQQQCYSCSLLSHCITCTSKSSCTSCQQSYTLVAGKCTCPSSHYIDPKDSLCKQCEPGCLLCTAKDNCSKCDKGYVLKDNTCVKSKYIWRKLEIIAGVMLIAAALFGLLRG